MVLIALESSTRLLAPVRGQLEGLISPVYLITQAPYQATRQLDEVVSTHTDLRERNRQLRRQLLELAQISQQFVALKAENDRLRELLGSQARLPYDVLIAEIIGVIPAPDTHQIIIDKGSDAGLEVGQPILDSEGVFGQVVSVAPFSSRVLLITDKDHAVPVQLNRNGVRSIAGGTGTRDALLLENVPVTTDIQEGDLVETSGLGNRFPRGYPVGRVASVVIEATSAFAQVVVRPVARLDRSRHVLAVFTDEAPLLEGDFVDDGAAEALVPDDDGEPES